MKSSRIKPAPSSVFHQFLRDSFVAATGACILAAAANANANANAENHTMEVIEVRGKSLDNRLSLQATSSTASRLDLKIKDVPASVVVISQAVIRERGARTALEAIESAVGMTGGTGVGSIPGYATRGFTSNDITVMRDGIRQNTNSQSARPLDSFLFERIEVLKGPASLLHGEGAVGGAVNYVSKLPTESWHGEVIASAGSWDTYRTGVGAGGPTGIDNLYFRADASRNQSNGYVDGSREQYDAYAGSLLWEPSDRTRVILSGTWLEDDVESYYGTPIIYDAVIGLNGEQEVRPANTATDTLVNPRIASGTRRLNYNHLDNFARSENSFWRLVVETELSEGWSLCNELYAATQKLDWRNTERTVWNPVTGQVDRSSFFLIYRDDLQIGNRLDLRWKGDLMGLPSQILLGALFDTNEQKRNSGQVYANKPIPASVPLRDFDRGYGPNAVPEKTLEVTTETMALYLENLIDLTKNLKLVGGLRYDQIDLERISFTGAPRYTKSYYPWTGRLGAVYAMTPDINLYTSYSRAAQPVSQLVSLSASQDEFSLQKGEQYEVGLKGTFWEDRVDLTLAVFDIEKNDLLTSEVINGVRINSQIGAQVSQGAELAMVFNLPEGWQVDANLAWTWKVEFEKFNENLGTTVISRDGNTPTNVPAVVAGLHIARTFDHWLLGAGVRHVGEREANNNGIQLDAYTTVDASVGYRWSHLNLTLRGRNLTDRTYTEWASVGGLPRRLANPRSMEVGLHYDF